MVKVSAKLQRLKKQNLSKDQLLAECQKIINEKDLEIKSLNKELNRLNVIIDLIPNTISWVNKDFTYFGVNRALSKTCGLEPKDFIGKPIGFHTKERFFYEFVTELFRSSNDTIYREIEAKISGEEHTYLVSGTKLEDKDKAVVIGVDVTELVKLKGHVSFTEKLVTLGEMFAGIIHDINNPIMLIDGSVKRIKKKVDDEEVQDILSKIELSSKKIAKIIQGIKIYIRQDEAAQFNQEDLGKILDDAIVICEHKLKENSVALQFDPKINGQMINCNFTQIFQVFVNLISNSVDAVKNSHESKWIEISLGKCDDSQIEIFVKDSGHGIPIEIREKIFHAFFTTKDRGVGSGLGLSLCSKILEGHGATIEIVENPNTMFKITFKK